MFRTEMRWNTEYDRSELFDDFFVGSAFGFYHFEVGVGRTNDSAGSEEEKARISIISGHDSFDNGRDCSDYPSGYPPDDVEHYNLLRRDYFRDIRP